MMRLRAAFTMLCFAGLAACSSVTVPEHHSYRLATPQVGVGAKPDGGVLRVGGLELAADLAGDRLMVGDGPVKVMAYRQHTWAGPLERLVGDAVVTGLRRSCAFEQVKTETARGDEDLQLDGRVLDFHQTAGHGAWLGTVTLDLQLVDRDGRQLLGGEFSASTALQGEGPEALVVALSESLGVVLDDFVATCGDRGVFVRSIEAGPGR